MKYLKRIALLSALVICVAALGGCGGGLEEVSKGLTTYTINADYDDTTHTLTASMSVDYVNIANVEIDKAQFHLYPAAYREGARYAPIAKDEEAKAYPSGKNYGGMKVEAVKVEGGANEVLIGGSDNDILTVSFDDKLLPGAKKKIIIDFTVSLANVRHRLGWYGKTVNFGNFYPVACVYENGGFRNDPYYSTGDPFYSETANYDVTVRFPSKFTAAHTGSGTTEEKDGITTLKASAKAVRDFAFVLGEFDVKETRAGDTSVKYYYCSDADPDSSLKAAKDAIETFGSMFGKYPYDTYSVVQTAFLQGGMEYPNLSLVSDVLNPSAYVDAIVHETAHQWWYGVVGNDEIHSSWLDEGLTEYSTSLFYAKNPDYNVEFDKRISDSMSSYILFIEMYKNGKDPDTSMDRSLAEYSGNMEYTFMTYVKGQLMLDNLRRIIGDDSFYAALKDYYSTYSFKVAVPDSLIACFEKASSRELKGYFDSWVDGKVLVYT